MVSTGSYANQASGAIPTDGAQAGHKHLLDGAELFGVDERESLGNQPPGHDEHACSECCLTGHTRRHYTDLLPFASFLERKVRGAWNPDRRLESLTLNNPVP